MTEEYAGTKFETVFISSGGPRLGEKSAELINWCRAFEEKGLMPPYLFGGKECSAGNLSYRQGKGFVITPSGKNAAALSAADLVEVVECSAAGKKVFVRGKNAPSSEAFMHCLVYEKRKDVNAVFHGHDAAVLEKAAPLGLPSTREEKPYGSIELAEEVVEALGKQSYLVIKNHGFLAVGKTMDEAGRKALEVNARAVKA